MFIGSVIITYTLSCVCGGGGRGGRGVSFWEAAPVVEFMYLVFTHMPGVIIVQFPQTIQVFLV